MSSLTWLSARNSNIISLTGLEFATNLTHLYLHDRKVFGVWVNSNAITNFSPLSGLTNLTDLYLGNNAITDISPLSGLTNLTNLILYDNTITDISPLSGLTNLTELVLWENSITDVSPLEGLINLTILELSNNPIADFSPLCALQDNNPEMELDIEILCGPYALFMQDFSNDGEVNLSDLFFLLALLFAPAGGGDWNGDGVVDFLDLVAVAEWVSESTTGEAPSIRLTPTGSKETLQAWIDMAHAADDGSLASQEGIANLKRFLDAMRPETTELLPNYPNPFNPETWIPYHLAHAADVTLTIYDTQGVLVRQLDLGYQQAGYYTDRTRRCALGWS